MRIEESLPFPECVNCNRYVMKVNEQTYLYPIGTERVIKVTCKHQRECIKQYQKAKENGEIEHEN